MGSGATADDTKAGVERLAVIHGGEFGGGGDGCNWNSGAGFPQSIQEFWQTVAGHNTKLWMNERM